MGLITFLFPKFKDENLGEFRYSFGKWTANKANVFGMPEVRVRIPGRRSGPDSSSLELLRELGGNYKKLQAQIAPHLFELYTNLTSSMDEASRVEFEEQLGSPLPTISSHSNVWPHVKLVRVWVNAYGKDKDIELAYWPSWEIEHTAGAVIRDGQVIEFSASVGPW